MNTSKTVWLLSLLFLVVGLVAGYWYGSQDAYNRGYQKAAAEAKAMQIEIAKKAAEETAKALNPFQATNPLEGVSANPFKDAAKKLNPFAQ